MRRSRHQISEPTRRNIADELLMRGMAPEGRLDEVAFFSRLFDLSALPTRDSRRQQFPNMAADLRQHRVNNSDWPDGWWWTDDRLDLLHSADEVFLSFLAEMIHPVVRPDPKDREPYLDVFNRHLNPEGWEISPISQVGAHPVYGARHLETVPTAVVEEARSIGEALGAYVARQITRMEAALPADPELAIGSAKEFLETVCRTVLREREIQPPATDDLPALVKLTIKSLPVVPAGIEQPDKWSAVVVRLINNMSSLGQSLAELRNAFGTGHGKEAGHTGLQAHHARLIVRVTTGVGVFLYETHERHPLEEE